MKKAHIFIALLFTASFVFAGSGCVLPWVVSGDDGGQNDDGGTTPPDIPPPSSSDVRLVFAGDVMMARKVETSVSTNGGGNYSFLFAKIASFMQSADIAFANLESAITDKGSARSLSQVLQGISFRAKPAAINGLLSAGIDIVSMANNHTLDYNVAGMSDCINRLKAAGIQYVGAGLTFNDAYAARIFTVKNTRIAYLAYTLVGVELKDRAQKDEPLDGLKPQSGVAWYYSKYVDPAIRAARSQADLIVVSIHYGTDYSVDSSTTDPSHEQDRFAYLALDEGADIVIGHHTHITQPVMVHIKKYLAYSLGNCVFDQSATLTKQGMLLEVTVRDRKIAEVVERKIQINQYYQPELVN